jgi:hypothetical protein
MNGQSKGPAKTKGKNSKLEGQGLPCDKLVGVTVSQEIRQTKKNQQISRIRITG